MTSPDPAPPPADDLTPEQAAAAAARTAAYLADMAAPCQSCGHQNAVHTGGSVRGPWSNWAIYEPVWRDASGWCNQPGCACTGRLPAPVAAPRVFKPVVARRTPRRRAA